MTPVTPEGDITVAGTPFRLDPSFKTLAAVQHAFREDLISVQARAFDMRLDEIATLLATASGGSPHEVGQLLIDELDVSGGDYQMLKAELMGWLGVAMTPRRDREDVTDAYDGYALTKGITKTDDPDRYPDEESRKRLRELDEKVRATHD